MADQLKAAALALYKPPFKFESGYFFDADGNMVADKHEAELMRVRGWGRISHKGNPEALQDMVGAMIADAMTTAWNTRAESVGMPTVQAGDEPEAYILTDVGGNAPDDYFDYERIELASQISAEELKRFVDAGRAEPLYTRSTKVSAAPSQPVAVPSDEMIEKTARQLLHDAYSEHLGEGPYRTYADLALYGKGSFTVCSIRAIKRALTTANAGKDAK